MQPTSMMQNVASLFKTALLAFKKKTKIIGCNQLLLDATDIDDANCRVLADRRVLVMKNKKTKKEDVPLSLSLKRRWRTRPFLFFHAFSKRMPVLKADKSSSHKA